jgi:cell division protein FtsQ
MDRSLTARLGRPFFASTPRRRPERQGRSIVDLLWRPFDAIGGLTRTCFLLIARRRRLRIALLAVLVTLPLFAGGWLWLRNSSLVSVEHVRVSGLHGPEARAIERALAGAAVHMSTLDVHTGALRAAVASFPVVRTVRAIPSFPHGLRIEVTEQLPVAALTIGGTRTAVAADGVVLGSALLSGPLPTLSDGQGAAAAPVEGQHLKDQSLLAELTVLGAAPKALERVTARVFTSTGNQGLTLGMRDGLLVYFGDGARPHAKWLSLARVLADPSSAGASYIDERLPERPAAGFPAGSAHSSGGVASLAGQPVTPESTVAALAAGLAATTGTTGAGSPPTAGSPSTTEASSTAAQEAAAAAVPGATSTSTAESTPTSGAETPAAAPASGG